MSGPLDEQSIDEPKLSIEVAIHEKLPPGQRNIFIRDTDSMSCCNQAGSRDETRRIHALILPAGHLSRAASPVRALRLSMLAYPGAITHFPFYLAQSAFGEYRGHNPAQRDGNLFRRLLQQCQQ